MLCFERKHGGTGRASCALYPREPGDRPGRGTKSSVHKDLAERLPTFNRTLYLQVKEVLEQNKAERHIRGGIATRKKYKGA